MNPQAPGKTKVRVLVTHTTRTWYELEVDENLSDREIFQQAASLTPEQLAELPREDDPEGPRVRVRDFEHHIDPELVLQSLKRANSLVKRPITDRELVDAHYGTTKRFHDRQRLLASLEPLIAAGAITRTTGEHGSALLRYSRDCKETSKGRAGVS